MNDLLSIILSFYRGSTEDLKRFKAQNLPVNSIVTVDGNYGMIAPDGDCPADQIPVMFENQNIWWKPIEKVSRVTDLKSLPPWVRRMKIDHCTDRLVKIESQEIKRMKR